MRLNYKNKNHKITIKRIFNIKKRKKVNSKLLNRKELVLYFKKVI